MDFGQTTNTIDYGIRYVGGRGNETSIGLSRVGLMPMPIDVTIKYKDGTVEEYYIPLRMMRGEKPVSNNTTILEDWPWTHPSYSFIVGRPQSDIKAVVIDKNNKMADVNKYNNIYRSIPLPKKESTATAKGKN